ncbi:MAG: DNA/RNA non-specific endonuclease [Sphaerochaeta sp.]|nr:DNA/RNA non-specific endonuclease [Sphaerochaeta sp.]
MAKKKKLASVLDKKVSKAKIRGKKLLKLLLVLVILWILTLIFAPSEVEYTNTSAGSIPNLELPLISDGETIISHTGYTLSYDEEHEQARWVAYQLTRDELYGDFDRQDNFRADPSILTESSTLSDYRSSGYDRGHLIPAADLSYSEEAMSDSFFMSNMSPQEGQFNRGIWSKLEATVRNFADTEGEIYVVTGPVLTDGPYKTIGKSEVSVPNYYYKAILDYTEPEIKAIGFLLPNEGSSASLESFATTIDELEEVTNLDFFPKLPDVQEAALESTFTTKSWDFDTFQASSKEREQFAKQAATPQKTAKAHPIYSFAKGTLTGVLVMVKKETMKIINLFIPDDAKEKIQEVFN